jgi:hypothetical protein
MSRDLLSGQLAETLHYCQAYLAHWLEAKVGVVAHQPLMPGICSSVKAAALVSAPHAADSTRCCCLYA